MISIHCHPRASGMRRLPVLKNRMSSGKSLQEVAGSGFPHARE
jgi:hypothetical protein